MSSVKWNSARLMVVAILGFGFCWGPTFQVELLNFYGVRSESNFVFRIWYYLAQISCSCLNPAIYAILSPEFRNLVFKFCWYEIIMKIRCNRPCEFTKWQANCIWTRPEFRNLVFKFSCCNGTRHVFNRCCHHSHANLVQPTMWVYQASSKLH